MDRREAVLRELNLYPLWVRRSVPATEPKQVTESVVEPVAQAASAEPIKSQHPEPAPDEIKLSAPSQLSRADANVEIGESGWAEVKQRVHDCTACKLRAGCTQTVFGVGDEKADWLFVGEGPGADEDEQGEPFVGKAGQLLDNMLLAIKLKRGSKVYIANIVKCRPPGNRVPDAEEIAMCLPYLQKQIALIQPRIIVALGKTAATALLGKDAALGSLRGTVHNYRVETAADAPIPLVVTYHPAYLLRKPSEKAKAWQDLCLATDTMQEL